MKRNRVPKEVNWALRKAIETGIFGENWATAQEHRTEKEIWRDSGRGANKFELVHSTNQIASQDISSNKDKRGERSTRDIKGKHKEMYEDEFAMKDKERKKKKNGHFKKRCVAAKCETCNKIHTELCYL